MRSFQLKTVYYNDNGSDKCSKLGTATGVGFRLGPNADASNTTHPPGLDASNTTHPPGGGARVPHLDLCVLQLFCASLFRIGRRKTFASLDTLKPSVIEVCIPWIATLLEPSTATSTTTACAGFQIAALVASRGHRRCGLGSELTVLADLDALDPSVIEVFVPRIATVLEPSTATSTTTAFARFIGATLGAKRGGSTDLYALDPRVIELCVPWFAAIAGPSTAASTATSCTKLVDAALCARRQRCRF